MLKMSIISISCKHSDKNIYWVGSWSFKSRLTLGNANLVIYLKICKYKLLNNILFLSKMLFKFGMVLRSFCNSEEETPFHIFHDCMSKWYSKTEKVFQKIGETNKSILSLNNVFNLKRKVLFTLSVFINFFLHR